MGLSNKPEHVLDQKFFHMTGLAMVLGTLLAGAITVWLAHDTGRSVPTLVITRNIENRTGVSQKPNTFNGLISEVNFRIYEMVSNAR
jgi:hypothetical protein